LTKQARLPILGQMTTRDARVDTRHQALPARHPTLADIRDLPSLATATVVPSGADLAPEVRGIRPAGGEAAEGEVLVCDGAPPDPAPPGLVGVVCRIAPPKGYPVPALVLDRADAWAAVLDDLSDLVGPRRGRRAAERARSALRVPLLESRGFQGLTEACRNLLGAPVAVLDDYLDILADAGMDAAHTAQLEDAVREARGHGPASIVGPFFHDSPAEMARVLVPGRGERAQAVVVAWLDAPLAIGEISVLREMAEACALEIGRQEVRTQTEAALRGDLIRELMAGEAVSRDSLVRRARHLGADLAAGAVAMLGKLEDPHDPGRMITDERLARRFLQQTRAVLDMHWPRALVDWDDGRLLVLLPGPREQDDAQREEVERKAHTLSGRLIAATKETVPGLALTLAISRFTPEPERLGWPSRSVSAWAGWATWSPSRRPAPTSCCSRSSPTVRRSWPGSTTRPLARWCGTTSSTRPSWSRRWRRTWSSTATWRPRPARCSRTATPCATGWTASPNSVASTSGAPTTARS